MSRDVTVGDDPQEPPKRRALATARFVAQGHLDRQGYRQGDFWLGRTLNGLPFGWSEDTNLLTCAGPGAGKGVSSVIPNLLTFPGSAVVIDPKGELASTTAQYRRQDLGHKVIVLDPARVAEVPEELRGTYNPFESLDANVRGTATDAQAIASGIVVPNPKASDPYWDVTALDFIQSCILYMLVRYPRSQQTLMKLRETTALGNREAFDLYVEELKKGGNAEFSPSLADAFEHFLQELDSVTEFGGIVRETAAKLARAPDNTRGSILATVGSHMDFLKAEELWDVLQPSTDPQRTFRLDELRRQDRPLTVYLCLPVHMIPRQGQWFRIILSQITQFLEKTGNAFDKRKHHPVLLMMDEFFQLGPIPTITNTLTYSRSSGLRIWLITQDLNQLKKNYPQDWETIVGACGIKQFFGVNDHFTAEYISKLVGEEEVEVPSISMSRSMTKTDGTSGSRTKGRSTTNSEGASWSSSAGTSSSYTASNSRTDGTSHTTGTNSSFTNSQGTNTGTQKGTSTGTNKDPKDQKTGASSGTSTNTSTGTSTGRSETTGTSSSTTHNSSTSSSESWTHGTNLTETRGGSSSTAHGQSTADTSGWNQSSAQGETYSFTLSKQARRLLRPEEVMLSFTKDNLVQLAHIHGQGGMILYRTPYYADRDLKSLLVSIQPPHGT